MCPHLSILRPTTTTTPPSSTFHLPLLPSPRRLPLLSRSHRWNLNLNLDAEALQWRLGSWLEKAREALDGVKRSGQERIGRIGDGDGRRTDGIDEAIRGFVESEVTVHRRMKDGDLSLAAVISVEQFGRMNGLTGRKMRKIFEALASEDIQHDARSLVEYVCFRYLSRDSSEVHPSLKDIAFQRLIFITMLAWQQPYRSNEDSDASLSIPSQVLVEEEAFVRIAPAIAGVADRSTAHHLFKALVGDETGMSLSLWTTYVAELLKVHQGRLSYKNQGNLPMLSTEELLCMASSRKQPVLKWEENIAWPGNLTLTDSALYFEAIGLKGPKEPIRLDLSKPGSRVQKAKVGPFGSKLFDSAVAIFSGPDNADSWVLEFVDFGSETRRDVWNAFINEIIFLYDFIREFAPRDGDPSIHDVYGAEKGNRRAIRSAANSIARLQSLQFIRKISEDPAKLVQFSYLRTVPHGDIVLQALAVKFWSGPLVRQSKSVSQSGKLQRSQEDNSDGNSHLYDIDGSAYIRKWMRSPSWSSSSSILFWRNSSTTRKGIVLGKNLVVAGSDIVERATIICKEKSQIVEKTQASIDAAMIKGIPSNIDLFKELMLPIMIVTNNFEKLRRWEDPRTTVCFLAFAYTIIFRNLLSYVLPVSLMFLATTMLLLKGLKEQGRLGRYFGKVSIRDQPSSNTIQKIMALKEAMTEFESSLQNVNISLLKIRTILLSGQPEITRDAALVMLGGSLVLLIIPFRYIIAFLLLDLFTRELEFRREMVQQFRMFVREKWASIQAAPVVVLPYVEDVNGSSNGGATNKTEKADVDRLEKTQNNKSTSKQ